MFHFVAVRRYHHHRPTMVLYNNDIVVAFKYLYLTPQGYSLAILVQSYYYYLELQYIWDMDKEK